MLRTLVNTALLALLIFWRSPLCAEPGLKATAPADAERQEAPALSKPEAKPDAKPEVAPPQQNENPALAPPVSTPEPAPQARPTESVPQAKPAQPPSETTPAAEPNQQAKPAEPQAIPPAPTQEAKPAEPPPPPKPANIALLLPLDSKTFGRAAQAVRDGFLAAQQVHGASNSLPVQVYVSEENGQDLLTVYGTAIAENAKVVVGPMTRKEVTVISKSDNVPVPTLALNMPENETALPAQFYSLSLSQEAEARQVARIARAAGKLQAATIASDNVLSKRVQAAFALEWQKLGGTVLRDFAVPPEAKGLQELRLGLKAIPVDVVFLALDAVAARKVKPYINPRLAVYATSRVFRSKNEDVVSSDLQGVQFVDMPWLIKPDHAVVMSYPQPKQALNAELQRFYALGVDAFRISQILLQSENRPPAVEGVSGRITLNAGHLFNRELTGAVFDSTGAVKPAAQ